MTKEWMLTDKDTEWVETKLNYEGILGLNHALLAVAIYAQKKLLEYQDKYIGDYVRRLAAMDRANSSPALLYTGIDELSKLWGSLFKELEGL